MISFLAEKFCSATAHIRELIHGGISIRRVPFDRGFDVLKEGIYHDRNRKAKNRDG